MPRVSVSSSMIGRWIDRVWNPVGLACNRMCCANFVARCRISEVGWWITPQRVLVGPASLFDVGVPDVVIRDLFVVMGTADRHTFKVLGKDTDRMEQWFGSWEASEAEDLLHATGKEWPPENVHLGIQVSDQLTLDYHIAPLMNSPAAKRFVVIDQPRGPIDLTNIECPAAYSRGQVTVCRMCSESDLFCRNGSFNALAGGIDQVVLGCDAPAEPNNWAREISEQCWTHGINFQQIGAT